MNIHFDLIAPGSATADDIRAVANTALDRLAGDTWFVRQSTVDVSPHETVHGSDGGTTITAWDISVHAVLGPK